MSHSVVVAAKYKSLDALETAVRRCGGELVRNQSQHAFYGGHEPCLHAIKVAGTKTSGGYSGIWEIGVILASAEADAAYQLKYDSFGRPGAALDAVFGHGLSKLAEEYAAEVALRELAAAGFMTQRIDGPLATVGA